MTATQHKPIKHFFLKWFYPGWNFIPFTPILYFFIFTSTLAVILSNYPPIPFENLGAPKLIYVTWCYIGLSGPIMAFIGYQLTTKSHGKASYVGLWVMFGANVSMFLSLNAFFLAIFLDHSSPMKDLKLVARALISSIIVFVAYLSVKDAIAIVVTEKKAKEIRNDECQWQ